MSQPHRAVRPSQVFRDFRVLRLSRHFHRFHSPWPNSRAPLTQCANQAASPEQHGQQYGLAGGSTHRLSHHHWQRVHLPQLTGECRRKSGRLNAWRHFTHTVSPRSLGSTREGRCAGRCAWRCEWRCERRCVWKCPWTRTSTSAGWRIRTEPLSQGITQSGKRRGTRASQSVRHLLPLPWAPERHRIGSSPAAMVLPRDIQALLPGRTAVKGFAIENGRLCASRSKTRPALPSRTSKQRRIKSAAYTSSSTTQRTNVTDINPLHLGTQPSHQDAFSTPAKKEVSHG